MWVWIEQIGPAASTVLLAMLLPLALAIGGFVHGVKTGSRGGYILGTIATIAIIAVVAVNVADIVKENSARDALEHPQNYVIEILDKENVNSKEFQFPCKITNNTDKKLVGYRMELVITNWNGELLLRTSIPSSACEANSSEEFNLLVAVKGNTANELYDTDFAYMNVSVNVTYLQNEDRSSTFEQTRTLQTAHLEKLEQSYTDAVAAYNAGKYELAMELFSHLGSYKESSTYWENAYNALHAS